ncbi:hypothetical protein CEQ90_20595 [Lewinellaceae bacterium SD302]|nr:hypothetical protein CEQ90_20595 [Lewinellaceae bacterium SD302]
MYTTNTILRGCKIMLLSMSLIIAFGCESDGELYVGLDAYEYIEWKDETYHYDNNNLLLVKSDSLEIRRLINDGCFFTEELSKFKIYNNEENRKYIISGRDSIPINLEKINSDVYEMLGSHFNNTYTPAKKYRLKSSEIHRINELAGNSYEFEIDGIEYL